MISACRGQNGKEFMAPEILSVGAEVNGATAVLRGTLSVSRVDRCGFSLSDGETTLLLDATLEDNVFSATAKGLVFNKTYRWEAFAMAGSNTIRSQEQVLTVPEGAIPIPDPAFKAYLAERFDTDQDGELSLLESKQIWKISVTSNQFNIKSLKGIEYFQYLEVLEVFGDWVESNPDLSQFPYYYISHHYDWGDNRGPLGTLEEVDVSNNPKLRVLRLGNNSALGDKQKTLDLSNNPELEVLELHMTYLFYPEISHLKNLNTLNLSHLRGPLPDISIFPKLRFLDIGYEQSYRRMYIDVSNCPDLDHLWIGGVAEGFSDLALNPRLTHLQVMNNGLQELDLGKTPLLTELNASYNYLRTVDVSYNPYLKELRLSPMENDMLDTLFIAPGQVIPGVTENRSTEFIPERTKIVEKSPDNAIPIPDPAFKAYLLKDYDSNQDGEISRSEAQVIWRISFCTNELGVKSLSGIEFMPYLEEINCPGEFLEDVDLINREHYYLSNKYDNKGPIGTLESLNLSHNPKLRVLKVQNNAALGDFQHTLDLSKNLKLESIDLGFTALQMPDVSHLPGLLEMRFSNIWGPLPDLKPFTQLRALDLCYEKTGKRMDVDVSHCPYLEELYVGGIARTISDLSLNPELRILMDIGNGFTERDLSILPKLVDYHGHHNRYRTLDVSANPDLKLIMVSPMDDDLLDTLYIAPGQVIPGVTENRSTERIPERTIIKEKSVK